MVQPDLTRLTSSSSTSCHFAWLWCGITLSLAVLWSCAFNRSEVCQSYCEPKVIEILFAWLYRSICSCPSMLSLILWGHLEVVSIPDIMQLHSLLRLGVSPGHLRSKGQETASNLTSCQTSLADARRGNMWKYWLWIDHALLRAGARQHSPATFILFVRQVEDCLHFLEAGYRHCHEI